MSSERKAVHKEYTHTPKGIAEAKLDAKIERHFQQTHRGVPKGRSFAHWEHEYDKEAERKYKENFDAIFPDAPGAGY